MQEYYTSNLEISTKKYFYSVNRTNKELKNIILMGFMILNLNLDTDVKNINIHTYIILSS